MTFQGEGFTHQVSKAAELKVKLANLLAVQLFLNNVVLSDICCFPRGIQRRSSEVPFV